MKRYLSIVGVVSLFAGMMLTGGCVSKAEYDKALAACRRANDELDQSQKALRSVRAENEKLKAELANRDAIIKAKQDEIALLDSANAELRKNFDQLRELYEKAVGRSYVPSMDVVALPPQLDQALREFAKQHPELLEYLPRYGMVKLKADMTFEPGSDYVQAGAADVLAKFAEIMNSDAARNFNVYIAGHTDDIPIMRPETKRRHPSNWYLSAHRSVAVEQALEKAGLMAARIGVMGFSEYHPIAANAPGHKGNKQNRRVEIWIVPQNQFLTSSVAETPVDSAVPAETEK